MQVFLEKDEPRILPIPYYTEGEPGRRFWNLKRSAAHARRISELSGCADLRAFVLELNAPRSRFATLGCDHWIKGARHGGALIHEAGLYVDIVFDRYETAAKRGNYVDLFSRLRRRCSRLAGTPSTRGLSIVRLQLQRVHFADLDRDPAWLMSTWVFGAGSSERAACDRRRRGLGEVASLCGLVSRELDARLGAAGTPIPP